ncbi:hypothetical protein PYW07_012428 [Mythimna separata]|uniref:MADF domain-containing protein n=1 Tax=Mythimna separata TaxID=271217 RepID=A0AAD7YNC4_MYTSE|nr:hypothetical protein PYW07_012428 [Mythimna separata]
MKMNINQELLITLVHERPAIWDKSVEDYKNKRHKYDAWKEIFIHLNPSFQDLSGKERNNFGQVVMKKWTNMKDNWMKCNKKMSEYKSDSGAKKIRKYNYYDEMVFLKKIVEHRKTDSIMNELANDSSANENADRNQSSSGDGKPSEARKATTKNKKNKNQLSAVDINFMKYMGPTAQEERSRGTSTSMNFFKGISDIVDKFNDEDMIEFQFQVISIIRSIQQRQHNRFIPAPRNQWDLGYQGYQSSNLPPNVPLSMYEYPTAARSSFGISRQEYNFGHSSGMEATPNRPESHLSVYTENAESNSATSQASVEEKFDFSAAIE